MGMTIGQVLAFYADPEITKKEFPITQAYLDEHEPEEGKGDYIDLFHTFLAKGKEGRKADKEFYTWLEENSENQFAGVKSLSALMEKNSGYLRQHTMAEHLGPKDPLLQWWHLFISWAAGRESKRFGNRRDFDLGASMPQIKCHELLIWMCEASGVDDDETKKFNKRLLDAEVAWKAVNEKLNNCRKSIRDAIEQKIQESDEGEGQEA